MGEERRMCFNSHKRRPSRHVHFDYTLKPAWSGVMEISSNFKVNWKM
jgi:hypothetical protein